MNLTPILTPAPASGVACSWTSLMKILVLATANLVTWSALTSCSTSPPKEAVTQQTPDPTSSIWNDYGAKIDSLATPGTSIQAWRDLPPESEKLIRSKSELRQILSRYDSVSTERSDHYCRLLKRARKTVHYGFELDFRALVFFDDNDRTIGAYMMSN